jgi:Ca-activated chloride channel homolog
MTAYYLSWTPVILILLLAFSVFVHKQAKKRNNWVYKYWMIEETRSSAWSRYLVILVVFLLGIALLDIRGPEEKVSIDVPEKRTLIVIDTSASMLVEDVSPNRFSRALLLARHFIRSSNSDLKSIIVFSDQAKRIIPFTFDRDLLDSRLMAIESMDIQSGGSNIALAIEQAVQYIRSEQTNENITVGNILLITDGEEYGWEEAPINIPEGISLAVIGIGTARGGKIPLRTRDGSFRGYKRDNRSEVNSQLNEEYFKSILARSSSARYWIANSYSLPTDEVVAFFEKSFNEAVSMADVSHRPVYGYPLIGIGLFLMLCASCLSFGRRFRSGTQFLILLSILFLNMSEKSYANVEISSRGQELLEKMSFGDASKEEKLELAQEVLKAGEYESAKMLYSEIHKDEGSLAIEEMINMGTAQLFSGDIKAGLDTYEKLSKSKLGLDETVVDLMRNNILAAIRKKEEEQEQENQKSESEESDQDSSESNQSEQQENSEQSQNKSQESSEGESEEEEQEQESQDESEDETEKESDKGDDESEDEDEKDSEDESSSLEEDEVEQSEIPALIQQIMSDDRELQQQQLDMSTRDPRRARGSKDW